MNLKNFVSGILDGKLAKTGDFPELIHQKYPRKPINNIKCT